MSGIVGNVSSVTGSVYQAPAQHAAAAQAQAASSVPATFFHNPRVIQDPSAGYITQYLSANGSQIVSQTPSAVTVAYLRDGLAADGSPKQVVTA